MDWDDLRIFLAVARTESLSGAGRRLQIDPATVGRRIARLEDAIGASLFVKSPQGYALTEAGGRLMPHAERVFRTVQQSWHPDGWGEHTPWMRMFRNARVWVG